MSNRRPLTTCRIDLTDVERRLGDVGRAVPSEIARAQLGRAQAMIRAATGLIDGALRVGVDAVVEHRSANL